MILQKIVDRKKIQLEDEMSNISVRDLQDQIKNLNQAGEVSFYDSIKNYKGISIISEVKKASPSKGIIKEDFDPVKIAKEYSNNGVQAISVLTEKFFFQGDDRYLAEIRDEINTPLLRKDFIIDQKQIYQAKLLGANAILLIVSILSNDQIIEFQNLAKSLKMDSLVEVHNKEELDRAIHCDAKIIGINNRDLKTFHVDIKTTEFLMKEIPKDKIIISESGIESVNDMSYLDELGVDGVLIGETLMRAPSIGEKINELRSY